MSERNECLPVRVQGVSSCLLIGQHQSYTDTCFEVHVIVLVTHFRSVDHLVIVEFQSHAATDLVVGSHIDGHGDHTGSNLVFAFNNFSQSGQVLFHAETSSEIQVADYLTFHARENETDLYVFESITC